MPTSCPNGHATPVSAGCAYCTNQAVAVGYNDLATIDPGLAAQLVDQSTGTMVTAGSGAQLEWKCERGHTWKAAVNNRAKGRGCPYCANRAVLTGFNDLATTHPDIAATLLHPSPRAVAAGSTATAVWKCEKPHTWTAPIRARALSGRGCPYCANKAVLIGFNDLATVRPDLAALWADEERSATSVTYGSRYVALWNCTKADHPPYRQEVQRRGAERTIHGCPTCAAHSYVSRFETEVAEFIASLRSERTVLRSYRGIPSVTELDIFLPEDGVAIECNGVYYHSEAHRDKEYHAKKLAACNAAGVRLIQVWEDDWQYRSATVKALLAHKLGDSTLPRIPARRLNAQFIDGATARSFLDLYHIQGSATGTYYAALVDDDGPQAVMALTRRQRTLTLERYATAAIVSGGQSKLLRFVESKLEDWDTIVTFADLEVSDGALYDASGWERDVVIPPDYKYAVRGVRKHKFGYRLKRFRNDPTLTFEEGRTEAELAALNGLLRVWDSGKIRYVWTRK